MRILLAVLVAIACAVVAAVGAVFVLVGLGEQRGIDHAYVLGFGSPGADCGASKMIFNVSNGEQLDCSVNGIRPIGDPGGPPGFSDWQNGELRTLATHLGRDGLSEVDQDDLQRMASGFAKRVPAAARPYADQEFHGNQRILAGVAGIVAGIVGLVLMFKVGSR